MSQENVEAVQVAYAALNRGDIPTVLGLCHPDVVFDNTNAAFDGVVYQGDVAEERGGGRGTTGGSP
jgi:ketosteroid isomerase-like protein